MGGGADPVLGSVGQSCSRSCDPTAASSIKTTPPAPAVACRGHCGNAALLPVSVQLSAGAATHSKEEDDSSCRVLSSPGGYFISGRRKVKTFGHPVISFLTFSL